MTSMSRRAERAAADPERPEPSGGIPPGDPAGFADWVRPHLPAMARLAARLAPGADRDDVVQEALVRAWTKRRLYDPGRGSASAWLLAITADRAGKARRHAARRRAAMEPPPAASATDPDVSGPLPHSPRRRSPTRAGSRAP